MMRVGLGGRVSSAIAVMLFFATLALQGQSNLPKRISFERGHFSATVRNSVVRGTRDKYLLSAKAGQLLAVIITALEHNAAFSITKPTGGFLSGATDESDATKWNGKLPESGDYVIEVGGTRGNAKYTLRIVCK